MSCSMVLKIQRYPYLKKAKKCQNDGVFEMKQMNALKNLLTVNEL